jgi:hypothetical protein
MYIYLDESYNLKDRNKKQFISINGFMVADVKFLFKKWKEYRKPFVEKNVRIHAREKRFDVLREKAKCLLDRTDIILISAFQIVQDIPFNSGAYQKDKLNFDKLYYLMLIELFKIMHLEEYHQINIIVDNRKHKEVLGKEKFRQNVLAFLRNEFGQTKFDFYFQSSTTNILLELADFYSNIYYRAYMDDDVEFFKKYRPRYQLKNPLNKLTDALG